ncbi:hypothetical protein [uncultured Clostridium sp.]|uniref:hypothetical protein n=1 Tax=uncultured Clostridium sp. TaxID=59620 RepID=UPI0025EDDBF2|nr:hypothetical protein [uncultured Clostridium sp.]
MKNNIDSKILKVMNLAIKYIGKLTEEDLDKLINGNITFAVSDKHKNRLVKEITSENDWNNEIKKLKEFNNREEASEYIRKLKLSNEKLRNLGQALGISISKSTRKDNIIAMIVEGCIGNRLKIEGIRKGIIG